MTDQIRPNVLFVTGPAETARLVEAASARKDIAWTVVGDMDSAVTQVKQRQWNLVMIDLVAGGDVIALLDAITHNYPELPVVVLCDDGCVEEFPAALQRDNVETLTTPIEPAALKSMLEVLVPAHRVTLAASIKSGHGRKAIAGAGESFVEVIELAKRVAPTSVSVLITGESGSGKELVSELIHYQSSRDRGPFIRVNCSAVSESLLESELFGHEKGAFTGAHQQREGCFERASGGTLLLDEISETTQKLQAELLRVIEQQAFHRVGGAEIVRVNVRIISTSNRDLAGEVVRGRFRKDLYYRIKGVHLCLPALRQRKEDIPALVWHFVNEHAPEVRRAIHTLNKEMLEIFERYDWPGNIRQLRNVVRTALIFGSGGILSLDDAPSVLEELQPASSAPIETLCLRDVERQAILEALRRTKRNQTKAAQLLGITDRTLREKIRKYKQTGKLQTTGEAIW